MATLIHKNVWAWGRQDTIILKDGRAFCHVSVEDDNKAVAWLSNVCVLKLWRRFGFGNQLLKKAKEHAREM